MVPLIRPLFLMAHQDAVGKQRWGQQAVVRRVATGEGWQTAYRQLTVCDGPDFSRLVETCPDCVAGK